jgi:hypothetical protein
MAVQQWVSLLIFNTAWKYSLVCFLVLLQAQLHEMCLIKDLIIIACGIVGSRLLVFGLAAIGSDCVVTTHAHKNKYQVYIFFVSL